MSIVSFEEFTHELTDGEMGAVEVLSKCLLSNKGKDLSRTNKYISEKLKLQYGLNLSGARIRKVVNFIRTKGLIPNLIATSKGYFVSDDEDELRKYIYSLRQRARAILHVATVMEDHLNLKTQQ